MFCGVTSATCPLVDADAPLASDSDNPAAPKTGMALLRRLLFLIARFDMAQFSRLFGALNQSTPLRFVPLRPWRVRNRKARRIAANIAKLPELLRFGTETRNTGRLSMTRILGMHSGIPMSPSAAPMIRQRRTCIEQFTHDVVL